MPSEARSDSKPVTPAAARCPLPELFLETARRNWTRLSMADSAGRELSFGRALVGAMLFRRLVLDRCPDPTAERMIGVLLPPSVPTTLLNLGISLAGRVPVNLNYTAPAASLDQAVARCGIRTIFTAPKLLERARIPMRPGMVMIDDAAQRFPVLRQLLCAAAARLLPRRLLRRWLLPRPLALDSLATVIFSSGSTGVPKGVMLSHRNIVSNVEGVRQAINVNPSDCILGILPTFHAFGFTVGLWLPLVSGFAVVFHTNPLESRRIAELCRKYRVTILITTPTFAWDYVKRCAPEDFASLRLAIVGAEKMKPELAAAFKQKFGHELYQGYGCTELSPVVSVETPADLDGAGLESSKARGTVGRPIPGVEARVISLLTGGDVEPGQEGMLLVKGDGVMMGYLGDPERTRDVIRDDGWYTTGDLARIDRNGFITITDRLTRFSKIAGEMVPHLQVEDALERALGSADPHFIVTGVPVEQRGEKLIVLHTALDVPIDELLKRLGGSGLPKLWLPKRENFFRVDALPVLGSGKMDLKQVKDLARRLSQGVGASATREAPR